MVEVSKDAFFSVINHLPTKIDIMDQNNTTYANHTIAGENVGQAIYSHQTKKDDKIPVTSVKYFLNPKYPVKP